MYEVRLYRQSTWFRFRQGFWFFPLASLLKPGAGEALVRGFWACRRKIPEAPGHFQQTVHIALHHLTTFPLSAAVFLSHLRAFMSEVRIKAQSRELGDSFWNIRAVEKLGLCPAASCPPGTVFVKHQFPLSILHLLYLLLETYACFRNPYLHSLE